MRRKDRQFPKDETLLLLAGGEYGIMATVDQAGKPYGVPLSYFVLNGKIYFHCARVGHKIDNIRANPHVSFTVVGKVKAVYEKGFTTNYESVIAFGEVSEILDPEEKYRALYGLAEKYLPDHMEKADTEIRNSFERTAVYGIVIEKIDGKARKG